jgi:hypothetical protein
MKLTITEHEFGSRDGTGTSRCKHCNSIIGIGLGSDFVFPCNERFNEKQFQSWIYLHNYSKMNDKEYVKRYTSDIISKKNLLKAYKQTIHESINY